jgi:hypothetical protein
VEYFSIAAAAEAIGRDRRSVTRLEKAGYLPRPEHVLPGDPRTRWYSSSDLEMLRRVADETGFRTSKNKGKEFLEALTTEKHRRAEVGEKPARPWQNLVERFSFKEEDKDRQKVRRWDSMDGDGATPKTPRVPPTLCARCGMELLYRLDAAGQGAAYPWCERCGAVDLYPTPCARPECLRLLWPGACLRTG